MGYERHADVVSGTATAGTAGQPVTAPAPFVGKHDASQSREDNDVMKQARHMRDEWRRERYARLTG